MRRLIGWLEDRISIILFGNEPPMYISLGRIRLELERQRSIEDHDERYINEVQGRIKHGTKVQFKLVQNIGKRAFIEEVR